VILHLEKESALKEGLASELHDLFTASRVAGRQHEQVQPYDGLSTVLQTASFFCS